MSEDTTTALAVLEDSHSLVKALTNPLALLPAGLTEIYIAEEDEAKDLSRLPVGLLRVKHDGSIGGYENTENPDERFKQLTGVVLHNIPSHVLFPPGRRDKNYEQERKWGWPSWICRSENDEKPPRLHPKLTPEQEAEARRRGAGQSCLTCPLAKWEDEKGRRKQRPECQAQVSLVVFSREFGQPAMVQFNGTSIKPVERCLASFKRPPSFPTFAAITTLGSEPQQDGAEQWFSATAQRGPYAIEGQAVIPPDGFLHFRAMRRQLIDEAEAMVTRMTDEFVEQAHREGEAPPPTEDQGDGMDLDADGNLVDPAAGDAPPHPADDADQGLFQDGGESESGYPL